MDFVVHGLNHVRHEWLHLWKKVLACWILGGVNPLCLIFFRSCFGYVYLMASAVFQGWSNVPSGQFGAHGDILFGLLWIINLDPGGASGVRL